MNRFKLGEKVFDREQQSRGEIVKFYAVPTVVRLMDAGGFQWIARTVCCVPLRRRAPWESAPVRIPTGTAPVDCPPHELRVGDHILAGGRLIPIADLRYRAGATRTMILRNGAVCVAERIIRVYRKF